MKSLTSDMLRNQVEQNTVFLYISGTPMFPVNSDSAFVAEQLDLLQIPYGSCDLTKIDNESRLLLQKMAHSDEPPPLLFIKGHLVGTGAMLRPLFESGNIKTLLEQFGILNNHD